MPILQFNWSDFNPDCMSADEMRQWIAFIGTGRHPRVAKQWFPNTRGQFKLARLASHYLTNKLVAMELRLVGNIAAAAAYEAICDRIYTEFPPQFRW